MKRVSGILLLLAFATGLVFLACSDYKIPEGNIDSSSNGDSECDDECIPTPPEDSGDSNELDGNSSPSSPSNSSSSYIAAAKSSSSVAGTSSTVASSSSKVSSSSVAKSPCVEPMEGVPPGGTTSCIIKDGKCYTCNPDRGKECENVWIWKADNVNQPYWYKEVSCNGSIDPTPGVSSSTGTATSSNSGGGTSSAGGSGTPSYTPTEPGTETSKVTHYWDACKPSCSQPNKGGLRANSCNINSVKISPQVDEDRNECIRGGGEYACMNQAPWKVGNVSFGYVAAAIGNCGDCYQFDFPNGQVMVVMANNHGNINDGAKFDLMVPGGGVGDFNAFTKQIQTIGGVSNPDMGVQYGGFRGACNWEYSPSAANCVKQKCEDVFKNLPELKAGCLWYVNTLGTDEASWNNPIVKYKKVTCPKELTDRY